MFTSSTISQDLSTTIQPVNQSQPLQFYPAKLTASSTIYTKENLPAELTADWINPKIRLRADYKNPVDLTILDYRAAADSQMAMEYLPTADEARQILASLPANLPIITSIHTSDANGAPHDDIRWYSLSADGTFESTAYTDWQIVIDRLLGINRQSTQPLPITQAVATILPEIQSPSPVAQAVPVDVSNIQPPQQLQPSELITLFTQGVKELVAQSLVFRSVNFAAPIQSSDTQTNHSVLPEAQPSVKLALSNQPTQSASPDLSVIAPMQTAKFELPNFSSWEEWKVAPVQQTQPTLLEIRFNPLEQFATL